MLLSLESSHIGVSSSKKQENNKIWKRAITQGSKNMTRHQHIKELFTPSLAGIPNKNDTKIPKVICSWIKAPKNPLSLAGLISLTYKLGIDEPTPAQIPEINRPIINKPDQLKTFYISLTNMHPKISK